MIRLRSDYRDADAWDAFVLAHPEARFCHLHGYARVAAVYGFAPVHLAFERDGALVGVLPASRVSGLLSRGKLVSQPFSEYGGLLLDAALTRDELAEVAGLLRGYLVEQGIPFLEMHGCNGVPTPARGDLFSVGNPHRHAFLPLDRPPDRLFVEVVAHQVRKAVKKAQRSDVTVDEACDAERIERGFFPLYLVSMKRLGVPPHHIRYFLRCLDAFGERMKIFWAHKDGRTVAALLGFACGSRVNIVNIASDPDYWDHRPNDLLHWEFVCWAQRAGYRFFDFGSVRYDGQARYKEKWGCTVEDHAYFFVPGTQAVDAAPTFSSSSSWMQRSSELWSRYVPEAVGRAIGPTLRRLLVR